jgi:hypothetical protein
MEKIRILSHDISTQLASKTEDNLKAQKRIIQLENALDVAKISSMDTNKKLLSVINQLQDKIKELMHDKNIHDNSETNLDIKKINLLKDMMVRYDIKCVELNHNKLRVIELENAIKDLRQSNRTSNIDIGGLQPHQTRVIPICCREIATAQYSKTLKSRIVNTEHHAL